MNQLFKLAIQDNVRSALQEDLMTGDIHANLFPVNQRIQAEILTREETMVCGQPWVNGIFQALDASIECQWLVEEGQSVSANTILARLNGPTSGILAGERAALNFLQTLMATANQCKSLMNLIAHTSTQLLDTRKTLPGLRLAQKYAIQVAGGMNHRLGLWDAFMLKENHIEAAGGILQAVEAARRIDSNRWIEIEVENFEELEIALSTGVERIMLDNFKPEEVIQALKLREFLGVNIPFEASGNINQETILAYAETGVDYISTGSITKNIAAVDLSLRIL